MKSIELTKPVTTESLLKEFESRFNQTMDLGKLTREELEDVANKIRTKIHEITQNKHFGEELKDHGYQKNQMMLDVINQKIKEYAQNPIGDKPNPILDKARKPLKDKLGKGQALNPDERHAAAIFASGGSNARNREFT